MSFKTKTLLAAAMVMAMSAPAFAEGVLAIWGACGWPVVPAGFTAMPPALTVARMAASAISSIDGLPAFPSRSLGRAVAMA